MNGRDSLLMTALEAAVPLLIIKFRTEPFEVRQRIGAEAGYILASQADAMMFGSNRKPGAAARDLRKHRDHVRPVTRKVHDSCDVCRNGHPEYSSGEIFDFTARALAVGACQPGGVTFAGVHWCAFRHPWCANAQGKPAPDCCKCGPSCPVSAGQEGQCTVRRCRWCRNGCRETCNHPPPPRLPESASPPDIPMGFGPDKNNGDLYMPADDQAILPEVPDA